MHTPPPPIALFQMTTGFAVSQAIFTAARLNIAEHIAQFAGPGADRAPGATAAGQGVATPEPVPIALLASRSNSHPDSLYRLLRALASVGIFTEPTPRAFANTPMSTLLRPNIPGSQYAGALMIAQHCYPAFEELLYSVQTGSPGFDKRFGAPLFDHLSTHPQEGHLFDQAMQSIHGPETPAMLAAFDFTAFKSIVDVGGGNGHTLLEVLRAAPRARGIVFDLPGVVERTTPLIVAAGMAERCRAEAGSFFDAVPEGADAYILRHIIHDWDDAKSVRILSRCREAMAPGGRVLVVESVIPPGDEPHPGKWLDLIMLAVPAGRERTRGQYEQLLTAAGLKLTRIVPTQSPVSVVEAVAV